MWLNLKSVAFVVGAGDADGIAALQSHCAENLARFKVPRIIVPVDAEGVQITPMHALGENNVHAVYYDNVRVHKSMMIGADALVLTTGILARGVEMSEKRVRLITLNGIIG